MIALEDRHAMAQNIQIARADGARLRPACEIAGIDLRTLQRWKAHAGLTAGDGRPQAVRPKLSHALTPDERAQLLSVANLPRFASVPPARIVPMLADEGVSWLASPASAGCCASTGKTPTVAGPRHPRPRVHRPRTSPRPRARSGVGT